MENIFARATPQLSVLNVGETAQFYRDVLGFKIDWTWEDNYASVSRDYTTFFLCAMPAPVAPTTCMITVSRIDPLCAEWREKGAKIVAEPEDKPWGLREFTIEDNNGHRFRIAQPHVASPKEIREPLDISLVRRVPAMEEYRRIITAVGWERLTDFAAAEKSLPRSLLCVVAEREGEMLGLTRVMGDGAMYFYIMDVVVLPAFQGRGVGTALMNAAVEFIRETAPGGKALVGLFTGSNAHGFYARFGFEGPGTYLYGMSTKRLKAAE